MTTMEMLRHQRVELRRLAARRGVVELRVFGSAARGNDDGESDIDLLVRLEPGRSLLDLGGLAVDLQGRLGRRVDVVTEAGLRPRLRERVLREALPL